MIGDHDWKLEGLCRETDPELFFPDPSDHPTAKRAKAVCRKCPVLTTCRTAGFDDPNGIWGGLTPRDRQNARRRLHRQTLDIITQLDDDAA